MKRLLLLLPAFLFFIAQAYSQDSQNAYSSFFQKAYSENPRVPKGILEAIAFSNTRIQHITHGLQDAESCMEIPNAYGVMGLTLDGKNYFRNNLVLVSNLSHIDELTIMSDPEKNIMAYAKAYTSVLDLMNIESNDPSAHVKVLVALSELPSDGELQNDYALNTQLYSIFSFLNNKEYSDAYGFPQYNLDLPSVFGEDNYRVLSSPSVIITNTDIRNVQGQSYQRNSSTSQIFSTNYGPAIWNPTSCNYSSRNGTAISAVTIHTMQGTYAGAISWFKNCSAQVSAHYCVRSSDGQITQMVLESNKAWHVGIHNPYTIGIEHEGYINNAAWYTNAMYASSANLVKDICLSGYGIAPTTCYNGPSCNGGSSVCQISTAYRIKGHQQFSSQTHTDPGINWDWPKYYCLINNCGSGPVAAPPPPSVSTNLCGNKTLTRATPPSGITYYWQGTSCGTSTSNSAATYVATASGTYYLRAQDNNTNVWSNCTSVNVTVNQAPSNPPAPTVSSSTCGVTVLTHAAAPSGVTYYWQGTSCGTSTGNSSTTYSVTASGTYYLAARSTAGCWSGCSSLAVNVIASPAAPPVPASSSNNCGPKTLTHATPPSGTTYYWQGTSCGTSTTNSSLTYTVGTSGTYYLRAKSTSGCWSNCSSLAVNITPCPTNLATSVGGACPNKTVSLNWVNSGGTWTVDVSLDPAFNSVCSKTVANVTSVSAPSGFTPPLTLQPNATYHWRMKSGSNVLTGPPFSIPFCDIVTPATTIAPLNGWQNTTFTVNFADSDNNAVAKSFYNVSDFDGTEWRANGSRGFFNDNFDNSSLNAEWTPTNGLWSVTSGNLEQTDETSANTNVSAAVTQSLSNRYIYHFDAKIDGNGTNRKAGMHFFASSSSLSNRGNSYLIQMNVDGGTVEFYESINNVMSLVKQADYNFIAGQYYDFKIIYDRTTGKMDAYVNDILVESWLDASPITTGDFISFRTENSSLSVNYIEVLRSRSAAVTVNAGSASTNDIRYQNAGPNLSAGKILSLATDAQGNISTSASTPVNVDWTAPSAVGYANDGTGSDINSTLLMNQLSCNWAPSVDPNSGTTNYYYSIGVNPGDTSVVGWTNNNLQVLAMKSNLSLVMNQVYYFNVKVKNGAGLYSPVLSTNGQTVVASAIGFEELTSVSSFVVYPNPFKETVNINYTLSGSENITVTLTDVLGRTITSRSKTEHAGDHKVQISSSEHQLETGMYFLKFQTGSSAVVIKLILNK